MNLRKKKQAVGAFSVGAAVAALMTAAPAAIAQSTTFVPCSVPALKAAITAANAAGGGHLVLATGCAYTLTAAYNGEDGLPQITSDISIDGVGDTITRSSSEAFRIFDVAARGELTLSALTLSGGGPAGDGGGILNAGRLNLNTAVVTGNSAGGEGGGIANSGEVKINAGRVSVNRAVAGGGGIANSEAGKVRLRASSVDDNSVTGADAQGGGILDHGGTVIADLSGINSNAANGTGSSGAGVATFGGSVTLNAGTVGNNHAAAEPGGILNDGGFLALTLNPVFGNTPSNCSGSPTPVPGCFN